MAASVVRRLTIGDAMVLIAATALAVASYRQTVARVIRIEHETGAQLLAFRMSAPAYLALAWMVAVVILRLRRPRPSLRRIACQPGLVACCGALAAWALERLSFDAPAVARNPGALGRTLQGLLWYTIASPLPLAAGVASAWTLLLLGRRWRAEPSWIDRLGRLIGAFWVVDTLLYHWVFLG